MSHLEVTHLSWLPGGESTSAGPAPAELLCPSIPVLAITGAAAPHGSRERPSKTQVLKIPVLIFMAVHAMELNHPQHYRASETG